MDFYQTVITENRTGARTADLSLTRLMETVATINEMFMHVCFCMCVAFPGTTEEVPLYALICIYSM